MSVQPSTEAAAAASVAPAPAGRSLCVVETCRTVIVTLPAGFQTLEAVVADIRVKLQGMATAEAYTDDFSTVQEWILNIHEALPKDQYRALWGEYVDVCAGRSAAFPAFFDSGEPDDDDYFIEGSVDWETKQNE